ncbi:hypothetical protein AG1IA_05643 [Rhizoctonia solani AG-1 IA]|uniref:Uncharacterized protein n=2 Tax=Rhizoctonia solani TaxID=456999 RepID=A0A8H3AUQ2_9AGAM
MSSNSQVTQSNNVAHDHKNIDGVRALEEALAGINSVLSREGEELSEQDLAKVLKQLEAAEGVADDVEGKLDEMLKNLGGMIEGLESDKKDGQGPTTGGTQT